jgi:molybdopterin converting factor small subunit
MSASSKHDCEASVKVLVKYLVSLRERTGRKQEECRFPRGSSLQDLADLLKERYELSLPDPEIMAILNGRGWWQLPSRLSTEIKDGDVVCLFPPIFGG